ncbi:MAG: MFS transporter [Candidatus Shapirobacteria bacterium]
MKDYRAFLSVIRSKNFLCLWGSQILSQLTVNLINFVIILRVFERTRSTVAVSLVWIFYAIPVIMIGPFAGTLIDLWDKRRILILTTLGEAVVVLAYLAVWDKVWPIYAIILLFSLINQFYFPTEGATLPSTVVRKTLPLANSLFLFTVYGTLLIGYSLAGPLIRLVGREVPFLLGAVFLLLASYSVSQLPRAKKSKKEVNFQDFFDRFKEGYVFIRQEPRVLLPLILLALVQMIISLLSVLAPSFTTETLRANLLDAGVILILPVGLGAVGAMPLVIRLMRQGVRKKHLISAGLFGGGGAILLLALVIYRFTAIKIALASLIMTGLGASLITLLVPVQTLIQEITPAVLRGRVFGVLGFTVTLASILPVLFAASVADILGVNVILTIIALLILAVGFYSRREFYEIYTHHRT